MTICTNCDFVNQVASNCKLKISEILQILLSYKRRVSITLSSSFEMELWYCAMGCGLFPFFLWCERVLVLILLAKYFFFSFDTTLLWLRMLLDGVRMTFEIYETKIVDIENWRVMSFLCMFIVYLQLVTNYTLTSVRCLTYLILFFLKFCLSFCSPNLCVDNKFKFMLKEKIKISCLLL